MPDTRVIVGRSEFQTAAQLIAAIEKLIVGVNLDDVYVNDPEGNELGFVEVEQETLTDGSVGFNVVIGVVPE